MAEHGRIVVTGSAGHLGEGLVRVLRDRGAEVVGLDQQRSPFTDVVGSITDRDVVARALRGAEAVIHTATLHKPHVGTHDRRAFVDTNVHGSRCLLEEAVAQAVGAFAFTSTTSTFGRALTASRDGVAAWITEQTCPAPKNIYWQPRYDFRRVLEGLRAGREPRSDLARAVGAKGYHDGVYEGDGPYPVSG